MITLFDLSTPLLIITSFWCKKKLIIPGCYSRNPYNITYTEFVVALLHTAKVKFVSLSELTTLEHGAFRKLNSFDSWPCHAVIHYGALFTQPDTKKLFRESPINNWTISPQVEHNNCSQICLLLLPKHNDYLRYW